MHGSAHIGAGALALVLASTAVAVAHEGDTAAGDVAPAPRAGDTLSAYPPGFPGADVTVDEHPLAQVPFDAQLRTLDGGTTTMGDLLAGDLPTILTFNYSSCPNLCSTQLASLSNGLAGVRWRLGKQFRIVTVVLDPSETIERAKDMHARFVQALPAGSDPAAWTFVLAPTAATRPGDDATVRRIADAVGFTYTFLAETGQYAHPAALMFLSTDGRVMQYMYGAQFEPQAIDASIVKAGMGTASTAVGFMYRCLHWDPAARSHAVQGRSMLRYGAAGFAVLVLSALGFFHLARRPRDASPGVVRS